MNPGEFVEAYKKAWRVGNGAYSSDVTAWDVGCDAGMLNFDVHMMRRSNFPEWYVSDYITRRLSSRSQHGPMQTMQNSGDRFTWPFNSTRRAVVTSIVCEVKPEDTVTINGDDAAMDRNCEALVFPDSPWVFKDINGPTVEFSGFELGGPKPHYSASGIHYRGLILQSRSPTPHADVNKRDPSIFSKWENYLDLLSYADTDTEEAIDVARMAYEYLPSDRFKLALPHTLRAMFPTVFTF